MDSNGNRILATTAPGNSTAHSWSVISLDRDGHQNWRASYGANDSIFSAMAIDSKDNVIVVGEEYNGSDYDWKIISYSSSSHLSGHINWDASYYPTCSYYYIGENDSRLSGVAIDSNDVVIVAGDCSYSDPNGLHLRSYVRVISYLPNGEIKWQNSYSGEHGYALASPRGAIVPTSVAVDSEDNIVVIGEEYDGSGCIVSYSSSGSLKWRSSYDSNGDNYTRYSATAGIIEEPPTTHSHMFVWDTPTDIAIDGSNGDIVVVGCIGDIGPDGLIIDISDSEETLPSAPVKALRPSMVDIIPAAETPDLEDGNYLGFGDSVVKGPHLKVEAALPAYLKQSDNSTLAIKIFIAAQMPDDYSRLAYFDSSNNLKFQPLGSLSSWKSSVRGTVSVTTVSLEVGLRSESSTIPSGTHYWCALVVPATVPDDFSGVDWSTTPWEITVNILDVQ